MTQEPTRPEQAGRKEIHLQLDCPKCQRTMRVHVQQLPHLLRCPGCQNSFWLGKSGKIESEHAGDAQQIVCPRCGERHIWPPGAAFKRIRCHGCAHEYLPDASMVEGATSAEGAAGSKKQAEAKPAISFDAIIKIAVGIIVLSAIFFLWRYWSGGTSRELQNSAETFTIASIAGDLETAQKHVSPEQRRDLEDWLRQRIGLLKPDPADKYDVVIEQLQEKQATLSVKIARGKLQPIVIVEIWNQTHDGRWLFNPRATLLK